MDPPDVRAHQTERQRHSCVVLASVCTYSGFPLLLASVLKHCLSLASLFALLFHLFLSLCPSFFLSVCFFYPAVLILSFSFYLLNFFLTISLFPPCSFCLYIFSIVP